MISESLKKKERMVDLFAVAIAIGLFLCLIAAPCASADAVPFHEEMARRIMTGVSSDAMDALNDMRMDNIAQDPFNSEDAAGKKTNNVSESIALIGAMWAVAVAMAHLLQKVERGGDYMESILKTFIELGVAGMVLLNLPAILVTIEGFGTEFAKEMTKAAGITTESAGMTPRQFVKSVFGFEGGNFLDQIRAIIIMLVPWIIVFFEGIAVKFIIFSLTFEIMLRRMFAPMAVADVYHEGLRSPGARYILKYFGAFLKLFVAIGACAIVHMAIMQELKIVPEFNRDTGKAFTYMAKVALYNAVCVGTMFKAGELANEILGVN